ncbi:MAG: hypothetical protein ABIC04_05945 [Nanoarchaeota archaeon]
MANFIVPTRNHGVFRYNPDFTLEDIAFSGLKGVEKSIDFFHHGQKAVGLLAKDMEFCILTEDGSEIRFNLGKHVSGVSKFTPKYQVDDKMNLTLILQTDSGLYFFDPACDRLNKYDTRFSYSKLIRHDGVSYIILTEQIGYNQVGRLFELGERLVDVQQFNNKPETIRKDGRDFLVSAKDGVVMSYSFDQGNTIIRDLARESGQDFGWYSLCPLWENNGVFGLQNKGYGTEEAALILLDVNLATITFKGNARHLKDMERSVAFDNYVGFISSENNIEVYDTRLIHRAHLWEIDPEYDAGTIEDRQYVEMIMPLNLISGKHYMVGTCTQEYNIYDVGFKHKGRRWFNPEYDKDHINRVHLSSKLHYARMSGNEFFVITSPDHCEILSSDMQLVNSFSGAGPDVITLQGNPDHLAIGMRSDQIHIYDPEIELVNNLNHIAERRTQSNREIISFHKL